MQLISIACTSQSRRWNTNMVEQCADHKHTFQLITTLSVSDTPGIKNNHYQNGPLHKISTFGWNWKKPFSFSWNHVQSLVSCHEPKFGIALMYIDSKGQSFPIAHSIPRAKCTINSITFFLKTMMFTERSKVPRSRRNAECCTVTPHC